jgi:hypothetical protein
LLMPVLNPADPAWSRPLPPPMFCLHIRSFHVNASSRLAHI